MNKFIFDVDGTLTPSRGIIDKEFGEFFKKFADTNYVYLVTGSDYNKTVEQCGEDIIMSVKRVYNCSGNDVWEKGKNIYRFGFGQSPFPVPDKVVDGAIS